MANCSCLSHSGCWKSLVCLLRSRKQVKARGQLSSRGISHWLAAGVKVKEFSFENFITAWGFFFFLIWSGFCSFLETGCFLGSTSKWYQQAVPVVTSIMRTNSDGCRVPCLGRTWLGGTWELSAKNTTPSLELCVLLLCRRSKGCCHCTELAVTTKLCTVLHKGCGENVVWNCC